MRVLHILWSGRTGGAERSVFQLARHQRAETPLDVAIGFGTAVGGFADRARADGIRVHDFGMRSGRDVGALRSARQILKEYDVHHFHCPEPLLLLASRSCPGVRRIYTHRAGVMRYRGRRALRYLGTRVLVGRGFAAVTAAPQSARAAAGILGIQPSTVVESFNGVDLPALGSGRSAASVRRELGVDEACVVIGTAATLRELKRVDWLLRSGALLRDGSWRIVILGDGPDRRRLEQIAADVLPPGRVVFAGMVADMGAWLSALDVFVLPSGPEEGFGNAVVEAMASGIPVVVCADSPALVSHVRPDETGMVVRDVAEMATAIAALADDAARRSRMGAAAQADALERYSMRACSRVFERLYVEQRGAGSVTGSAEVAA